MATSKFRVKPRETIVQKIEITGPWHVKFQADRGAPAEITLSNLISLNQHDLAGVKYFSGAATYVNSLEIPALLAGEKIRLNLGEVKNLAEIYVNGQKVTTLWKQPFVTDISAFVHAGTNQIEVKVINSWVNRLIGDAQKGAKKITYLSMPMMIQAGMPTETSGLLGPVTYERIK